MATESPKMVFIFSAPRAGSTMFQLMLNSHSKITTLPEPHVMIPLRYLGYYDKPSKAPYDTINTSLAINEFVDMLPGGEKNMLSACRAYAETLYGAAVDSTPGATIFVDKTPSNVIEWKFITKVFPDAKYIALVRDPMAIIHSRAETFFCGDYAEMVRDHTTATESYFAAVADFIENSSVDKLTVRYEDLINDPQGLAPNIFKFLELAPETSLADYGKGKYEKGALGDPLNAHNYSQPQKNFNEKWVAALKDDPQKVKIAQSILNKLDDHQLEVYGYPREQIFKPLESAGDIKVKIKKRRFNYYVFKRRVYLMLRKISRFGFFRKFLKSVNYYTDVLLRD